MVKLGLNFVNCIKPFYRPYSRISPYELPQKVHDAFYCSNASLVDHVNWYKHTALGIIFSDLIFEFKKRNSTISNEETKKSMLNLIEINDTYDSVLEVNYVVKLHDGWRKIIKGYRVHNSSLLYPSACIGGLRITPNVQKHELRALASVITQRNALLRIPLFGSCGAILVDPTEITKEDQTAVVKKYASELLNKNFCGHTIDTIEPDINTAFDEIEWIATSSNIDENYNGSTTVVGKPKSFSNALEDYDELVHNGAFHMIDLLLNDLEILNKIKVDPGCRGKTFILQGLGKYGYKIGSQLAKEGAICVGIKEHDCFTYWYEGLDIHEAFLYKQKHGSLLNFHSNTKPFESESIFKEECDILILAAKQNSLMCHVADKVQAKIIIEAAYAAITPTSYKILLGLNKFVLPDIVINCGFALLSYIEFLKNLDITENGAVTKKYTTNIKNYFATVCPYKEKKYIVEASGKVLSYPDNIFPDTLKEKELIKEVIQKIIPQIYQEIKENSANYKLDFDFKISAYSIALLNFYRNLFDKKLI